MLEEFKRWHGGKRAEDTEGVKDDCWVWKCAVDEQHDPH